MLAKIGEKVKVNFAKTMRLIVIVEKIPQTFSPFEQFRIYLLSV